MGNAESNCCSLGGYSVFSTFKYQGKFDNNASIRSQIRNAILSNEKYIICNIPSPEERSALLIYFLNTSSVILDYHMDRIHIHYSDRIDSMQFDQQLAILTCTKICMALSQNVSNIQVPKDISLSSSVYWMSILMGIKKAKMMMNCKICLENESTLAIRENLLPVF